MCGQKLPINILVKLTPEKFIFTVASKLKVKISKVKKLEEVEDEEKKKIKIRKMVL